MRTCRERLLKNQVLKNRWSSQQVKRESRRELDGSPSKRNMCRSKHG